MIRQCEWAAEVDDLCEIHLEQRERHGLCRIEGCDKPVTRPAMGWCEMHYYRHRRHGDTEYVRQAKVAMRVDRGYVLLLMPDHPMAAGRWVYEHRLVLYEALGPGPQECWWCGTTVEWGDGLHVDHLDHDRSNNNRANLVPSCQPCNQGRGNGCDPDGWAVACASRRVLRKHAEEFEREVEVMRARTQVVPYRKAAKRGPRLAQERAAALGAYEEIRLGKRRSR